MVYSLYLRLLTLQGLLLIVGGFLFWLVAIKLDFPEPLSLIVAAAACLVLAAIVMGIMLHPVELIHSALKHVAHGEGVSVSVADVRAPDLLPLIAALELIQSRLSAPLLPIAGRSAPEDAFSPLIAFPSPPAGGFPLSHEASMTPHAPQAAANTELLAVLNSLSEGVAILDVDLKIRLINTSLRTMAVSGDDAQAESPGDGLERYRNAFHSRCFVPDQLALIEDEVRKAPTRPRTDIIQLERPQQFLKRYSAPLYDEHQNHTGFLVSFTDITHEVVMDRLRQEFIANASHELRTPVTSVKVLLENLVEGAKDDPLVRDEFIRDAAMEIDRMHDLVNDLLDLAALESGRNTLKISDVEVAKVVNEAVSTVAPQAKHRDVKLDTEIAPDVETLEADPSRLRQVLVNLVANAVKFTPAGGQVKVKVWREKGAVLFAISDSGIGIPAQDLPHIFDRFFRVTRGRSRLQGGSGLGLTIVKQAIDAHRGEIGVESTEGQGSTFTFAMPEVQAPA